MFAVIRTGSKQYLVQPGDKIKVELLDVKEGKEIVLSEVLLCDNSGDVAIGTPLVDGAKVKARVIGTVKGEKLIIFKYKPKKRYKRKIGHRQQFTELEIISIER